MLAYVWAELNTPSEFAVVSHGFEMNVLACAPKPIDASRVSCYRAGCGAVLLVMAFYITWKITAPHELTSVQIVAKQMTYLALFVGRRQIDFFIPYSRRGMPDSWYISLPRPVFSSP